MRRELRQAGELERRQIVALQMLDQRRAVPREVRPDEEAVLLQADHRFRDAERASEMRRADEWLVEADAQPRAFDHRGPALLGAVRGEAEVSGVLQRIGPAAA